MKRKILTFKNEEGQIEDLIPYVDDLSIQIGGTNLRDYLSQIEGNLEMAKLFLGAFASESSLLEKYPNGSDLLVGTYAIVSDEDSLYIYDTDTARWLRTVSATLGIIQLNGLIPINGSLTITGGDINSTVPSATTTTQSITNHLNALYEAQQNDEFIKVGTIAYDYTSKTPTKSSSELTFRASVYDAFEKSRFLYTRLRNIADISGLNQNTLIYVEVQYQSGKTKKIKLLSADMKGLTYTDLVNFYGYPTNQPYVLIDLLQDEASNKGILISLNKTMHSTTKNQTYTIFENDWKTNEEGTGYKYIINAGTTNRSNSYVVLNVYKQTNNIKTTAIVDYKTENNVITIYSDVTFAGGATIQYTIG